MTGEVSKSSLGAFLQCKRRFYYSVLGYEQEENEYMKYGTEFHELIEDYNNMLIKNQGDGFQFKVPSKYQGNFEGYKLALNEIEKMGYNKIPYAAELPIVFDSLFGYIDVVFEGKDNHFLIIDLKTIPTFNEWDEGKYYQELYIYAYMFANTHKIPITNIEIGIIRFEQNGTKWDLNKIDINDALLELTLSLVNNMDNFLKTTNGSIEQFPKVDDNKNSFVCKSCPYFKICK